MTIAVARIADLDALAHEILPPSPPLDVTQEMVDAFARATGDEQWIHVDRERASRGPFGSTIAHGFLTLALIPRLWRATVEFAGIGMSVNYGLDRVRFPAPLVVPSRIVAHFRVDRLRRVSAGTDFTLHARIEREGSDKPVCIAEMLVRHYEDRG